MNRVTMLIGVVLACVFAVSVSADFTEDFESYTAGSALTSPWTTIGGLGMVASGDEGYNGSQGAYGNSPNWHISERATNYDPLEAVHELTWKARLSSNNGLARLTVGVGNAVSKILFEMDQRPVALPSVISWVGGSVLVDDDVWYTMTLRLFQDVGGNWSWQGTVEAEHGMGGDMGSGTLPFGWAPETVEMQSIWAWDEVGKVVSSIDDVSFQAVPGYVAEPAGFLDDFESYVVGESVGSPWVVGPAPDANMVVNTSGFDVSKGIYAPAAAWHGSYRSTNYDRSETDHALVWKARLSSYNGLGRLTVGVGSTAGEISFEMDQNVLAIGYPGGSVPVIVNAWYEMNVEVENDGIGNWSWLGLYRAHNGSDWGPWESMGSGTCPTGFTPSTVVTRGIWTYDETVDAAIDDVSLLAITDPTVCSEAIAQGHGMAGDVNNDCYVDLKDIAVIAQDWLRCINPADSGCASPWLAP